MSARPLSPGLAVALEQLLPAAIRMASYYGATIPEGYALQIREAVDAGQATLSVQIDLPSGAVRVLVDGEGFAGPTCLLALEASGDERPRLAS